MMRAMFRCAALVAAFQLTSATCRAVVVFEEDWSSGITGAKWITQSAGGGPFTFDLGAAALGDPGDSALFLRDASFSYTAGVRSVMDFDRSQALTASFKLFRDQGLSLDYVSVGGPWSNTTAPSGYLPDLEDIEAGFSTNQPNGRSYYVEDAPGINDWVTEPFSLAFSAALAAAVNKSLALDVKVTLGTSTGARFEWSVGAGPTTVEFDTIGQVAGTPWGNLANTVSDTNPLRLFFGGLGNGTSHAAAVIDDIVVTAVPEPSIGLLLVSLVGIVTGVRPRRAA